MNQDLLRELDCSILDRAAAFDKYYWRPSHGSSNHDHWEELVSYYSARVLSKQTDKLPALSGIAEHIAQAIDDQYFAGFFRCQLLHSLAWLPRTSVQFRRRPLNISLPVGAGL
jgi:hypothetical protein